jgi:serine/threonine protein kinase
VEARVGSFQVGDVIRDKYEVTGVLGQGGMGVVVAARHLQLHGLVAIKFLQSAIRDDKTSCDRFMTEARTATRIESEHVVRVFDVGTHEGTPFIVMEFLKGQDLAAELREHGQLPVTKAVDWLLQACEAVADAHNLGIVHRDLKPANFFLATQSDGTRAVKVLDFGISKSLTASTPSMTASNAAVGTPLYMSPEQLSCSKNVDQRSDVWSLGVILYEMLTGVVPYPGDSIATVGAKVFQGLYTRPSVRRPEIPEALDQAIADALTNELEKRLQTVHAFAARLAPHGSRSASDTLDRIGRIAARTPSADPGAAETTVADGGPAAVQPVQPMQPKRPRPATTTGAGTSRSIAPPPERPRRTRQALVVAAFGAVVAASAAVAFDGGPSSGLQGSTEPGTSAQPAAIAPPTASASASTSPSSSAPPAAASSAPVCPLEDADKGNLCHECRNQQCCATFLACRDLSACGDYKACAGACKSRSCKAACIKKYPEGHAVAAPLIACAADRCYAECDKSGGGACNDCQWSKCRKEAAACFGDPACDARFACSDACQGRSDACEDKCSSAASEAAEMLFKGLTTCETAHCSTACRLR